MKPLVGVHPGHPNEVFVTLGEKPEGQSAAIAIPGLQLMSMEVPPRLGFAALSADQQGDVSRQMIAPITETMRKALAEYGIWV
jgi:hypothetical protein